MCGIFGSEEVAEVQSTIDAMRHRGPDSQRTFAYKHFALAFARLAIVDVANDHAQQPYVNPRTGNLTVFNGELYNYRALDPKLTEIELLAQMIEEREDPRLYVDGDYVIAHYNPSLHLLTMYRDRFGVCPLYYQLHPVVAVSSEARRLINPVEVPAHSKVTIDVKERRLMSVERMPLYGAVSGEASLTVLNQLFFDAVRSRAVHSESSFSLALSGGLDSSLILLSLMKVGGITPNCCLVTAFSQESDDLHYARILCNKLRVALVEIMVTPDLIDSSTEAIVEHLDRPRLMTDLRFQGALRSWFVAQTSGTRVVLCGDGADELLGGYPSHQVQGEYRRSHKRITSIYSMQHFNLDRTNKMGMAHSREFRPPFLASALSQYLLSLRWRQGKESLRKLARYLGAPEIAERAEKYSPDELLVRRSA